MGIFGSLNTAYTGLQTSQVAIEVTSNNVANASNADYTRQRAVIQARTPLNTPGGDIGTGSQSYTVQRVHDEFVFARYRNTSTNKEYSSFQKDTLEEVSKYFPDMQNQGLENDITNYFNAWQSFAADPADSSQKIAVTEKAKNLASRITDTRNRLLDVQNSLNDRLQANVNEINQDAQQIATINAKIANNESNGVNNANDLRDQRDKLEMAISKLISPSITKTNITSDMTLDPRFADKTLNYTMQVGGYPLVDGQNYHPLVIQTDTNAGINKFNSIYFQQQDQTLVNISDRIKGGVIGSMLDLRGVNIEKNTGTPTTGKIQAYIDKLDTFAHTLISATNSIYAQSANSSMYSNLFPQNTTDPISYLGKNIKNGAFDVVVYDQQGKEMARKTINVYPDQDSLQAVADKINTASDDNKDNISTNDVASYFTANYNYSGGRGQFVIQPNSSSNALSLGYKVAIVDSSTNPSNFAGELGLGRFFDGNNATDIALKNEFVLDPSKINSSGPSVPGDNSVANKILQLQYDDVEFKERVGTISKNTISGYYKDLSSLAASDAQSAGQTDDTFKAVLSAVTQEYTSISKVSTDEELTSLIKFQSGYGACAKVVSTIDQMINTLLGMKQ